MSLDIIILMTFVMLMAYWFNHLMGDPLDESVDDKAILFFIPYWLALRRIRGCASYEQACTELIDDLKVISDPVVRQSVLREHRIRIYRLGREMFTYERAFLCKACFHFWISMIVLIFVQEFYNALFLYLINHLIIRKI